MTAYLLERLYPTGWRRSGQLYWRFVDADREAKKLVKNHDARGVRILPVSIGSEAVTELIPDAEERAELVDSGGPSR